MGTQRHTWTCSDEFYERWVAPLPASVSVSELTRKAIITEHQRLGLDAPKAQPKIEGETPLFEEKAS